MMHICGTLLRNDCTDYVRFLVFMGNSQNYLFDPYVRVFDCKMSFCVYFLFG